MSYVVFSGTVIGNQTLTGYTLANEERDTQDNLVQTLTTYFDQSMTEVGVKIENAETGSTYISFKSYADDAAMVAGNYTEYGTFFLRLAALSRSKQGGSSHSLQTCLMAAPRLSEWTAVPK